VTYAPAPTYTAPPPPAPAPRPSAPQEPVEEGEGRERPSFKLELGATARQVHGLALTGGDGRIGFGAQSRTIAHYAGIGFFYGGTEHGLRSYALMFGWGMEGRFERFRVGIGAEAGWLFVRRATLNKRMYALGIGAWVQATFDLVKMGRHEDGAFYAGVRLAGSLHYGEAGFWGPSVLAGLRF
jgi:hypothetical protein